MARGTPVVDAVQDGLLDEDGSLALSCGGDFKRHTVGGDPPSHPAVGDDEVRDVSRAAFTRPVPRHRPGGRSDDLGGDGRFSSAQSKGRPVALDPIADFHCDEWVAAKPTLTHTRPVTRRASGQAAAVELALVDRAGRCCGAARRPEPDLRSRETCNVPDPGELQGNMPPRLQGKKRARALPIVMTSAKFAWRGAAMWIGKTLSRSCGAPS